MRFLTWAFRNVLYVRVGKLIVCLWRSQCSQTVVWGGSQWDGSWKTLATAAAGAGATPTGAGAADMPRQSTNRTPTWTSNLRRRYFVWNWTIPVVMLATVVATTATFSSNSFSSNSCKITMFAANDTFLREANRYKRALTLRNSRLKVPLNPKQTNKQSSANVY